MNNTWLAQDTSQQLTGIASSCMYARAEATPAACRNASSIGNHNRTRARQNQLEPSGESVPIAADSVPRERYSMAMNVPRCCRNSARSSGRNSSSGKSSSSSSSSRSSSSGGSSSSRSSSRNSALLLLLCAFCLVKRGECSGSTRCPRARRGSSALLLLL